jgi:hypothetical protein
MDSIQKFTECLDEVYKAIPNKEKAKKIIAKLTKAVTKNMPDEEVKKVVAVVAMLADFNAPSVEEPEDVYIKIDTTKFCPVSTLGGECSCGKPAYTLGDFIKEQFRTTP